MQAAAIRTGGSMAIHYGDDLIRFPADTEPLTEKQRQREQIRRDVEAFEAAGNQVTQCGTESGVHYPVRQSKKALVNFMRRRSFQRRTGRQPLADA